MLQRSVKADRKAGRGGGSRTNMITSKNVKHFNAQNKGNPKYTLDREAGFQRYPSVTKTCKAVHVFLLTLPCYNSVPVNNFLEEMLLERRLHSGQSERLLGLPAV